MPRTDTKQLELIPSELEDQDTIPASYDIVTYPADYTLEGLVAKLHKSIIISGFQRKYVWNIKQASRLIESFLLGLPVPAIFLFADPEINKFLVVDGQQRLISISYFFEGYFGQADDKGHRTVFKLQGLNEKSPYAGKTFNDLQAEDEAAVSRLKESVLRAFIVKQLRPEGRSSVYHIFERLNTGGTQLVGQEIRNCVFDGTFNYSLHQLNTLKEWRLVFGSKTEDKHLRDAELILRFMALYHESANYSKPMKDFLSEFMRKNKNANEKKIESFEKLFKTTTKAIYKHLGEKPFHIYKGLNVAAFDGVYVAFAKHLNEIPANISERYKKLLSDNTFQEVISSATTDEAVVKDRLAIVSKILFG
jgi:uncharacterized protein with ParB-like and HNH nuclease domain